MFRDLSFVLVVLISLQSCADKHRQAKSTGKFDVASYYKENQNARVLRFLNESNLLRPDLPQEIYFINRSPGCSACLRSKYDEVLEILKRTRVKSLVIVNDSSYLGKTGNPQVEFHYYSTDRLKSYSLFHSTPMLYSCLNNKLTDQKLTVEVCDSLLNRFTNSAK